MSAVKAATEHEFDSLAALMKNYFELNWTNSNGLAVFPHMKLSSVYVVYRKLVV